MKKFRLLFLIMILGFSLSNAQKIGVVDTDFLLTQLPQYKEAESRMNELVKSWETEIQELQKEYDTKKIAFDNERVLLVGKQLKEREKELEILDEKIKKFVNTRFGSNGELVNSRANFTKPFQDQIWAAVKTVVDKNGLGIIIDKSKNSVLFIDKKYDYTDKVLDVLMKKTSSNEKEKKNNKKDSKK